MMKKAYIYNKVKKAGVLTMSSLLFVSCNDFLDKEPDDRVELATENQVVMLLTGSYPDNNYGWFCELSSDNIMDLNSEHYPISDDAEQTLTHYNLGSSGRQDDEAYRFEPVKSSTSSDTPGGTWTSTYITINSVNEVLEAIDRLTDNGRAMTPQLSAAKGEALLIRAYCHFILVNIFSQAYKNDELSKADIGVPYITEVINTVDGTYSRSNVTDTYKKIVADLEEGLKNISNINYEMPKWHFNEDAAHAFAARVYLFLHQWDKVVEHANFVLGTDNAQLMPKLFDYAPLDDCSYLDDFANVWQTPYDYNNIMLIDTYSTIFRKSRYRYEQGSLVARAIYYHNAPMWRRWVGNPTIFVSGLFGSRDYGFEPSWIGEQFQYSDKVAGIGYAHVIRRELTCNELLLNRAEAYLLGRHDVKEALADMLAFDNSRWSFSESNKAFYTEGGALSELTEAKLLSWYKPTESNVKNHSNTLADWNFTQNMSADFIITEDLVPYMNCLNDMRRYYTAWTGLRFFDVKRWGYEYEHHYGPDDEVFKLEWNSPNRAIEVPQEVIGAGMETSRPQVAKQGGDSFSKSTDAVMKEQ